MRLLLIINLIWKTALANAQVQCKLVIPGDHLGYAFESFNEQNIPVKTEVKPGESWVAIYEKDGYFSTKPEVLTWDAKTGFTIASKGKTQPLFYVQGVKPLRKSGPCTTYRGYMPGEPIQLKTWSFQDTIYAISYSRDLVTKKLAAYTHGKIQFNEPLTVFKGVSPTLLRQVENQAQYHVGLRWTGDLNGDGEPDFLVYRDTHHEEPSLELIISTKTAKGTIWRRKARFTEWS